MGKSWLRLRNNFSGRDGLADVALRVVGDVHEQRANRGGQGIAADRTFRFEIGLAEIADTSRAGGQGAGEFVEQFSVRGVWIFFECSAANCPSLSELPSA